ncbi:MAG: tRNA-uridine aminocarboxypropyltransferase [Telluria sp.]
MTRRPECPHCLRAASTCICALARPVATGVAVLLIQHRLEVRAAKGTGRLLHLSLPGSALLVGETFDPAELDAALHAGGRQPLLLYPGVSAPPAATLPPSGLRLVVIDATWRKSRKILHCNPVLAALPRLALDGVEGAYRIRKAHAPHQLSTMEAAAHALARLDAAAPSTQLLDAFAAFVAAQAALADSFVTSARLNAE